jgi:hypothetical protein
MAIVINTINKEDYFVIMPGRVLKKVLFLTYTDSDFVENCIFRIVEDRHQLKDNYKIDLQPIDSNIASESFYISDFTLMAENGFLTLLKKVHPSF